MKCPGCGYVSFDLLETCKQCGAPMVASATPGALGETPPAEPVSLADVPLPDDLRSLRLDAQLEDAPPARTGGSRRRGPRRARAPRGCAAGEREFAALSLDAAPRREQESCESSGAAQPEAGVEQDDGPAFRIDEDLFADRPAAAGSEPACAPFRLDSPEGEEAPLPALFELDVPALTCAEEAAGTEAGPIIDRDEEIPERFWAPEVAGLGRRGLALVFDQALLGALLGVFFLGAYAALRLSGFEADALLAAAGLQAALPPFSLLAALLSLVYHVFFHGWSGRTPGKALVGLEVRTGDGAVPSVPRAAARWFAAALGLSCAGAGIAWALFHPRRCGWADLLSATLIAETRRPDREEPARR